MSKRNHSLSPFLTEKIIAFFGHKSAAGIRITQWLAIIRVFCKKNKQELQNITSILAFKEGISPYNDYMKNLSKEKGTIPKKYSEEAESQAKFMQR